MRRVDHVLGSGVWEEPEDWCDEPPRNSLLASLLQWHNLEFHHNLLELFPYATRAWWVKQRGKIGTFDIILKCYYNPAKIQKMCNQESVLLSLIRKSA